VSSPLGPLPARFAVTVDSLHRVAEQLVAPARKPDNEIALTVTPGGFGTPRFEHEGAEHQVRVEADELVHDVGGEQRRAPLESLAGAGEIVAELLPPDAALDPEPLAVERDSAAALAAWHRFGQGALEHLRAGAAVAEAASEPILWPEHFDVAIELGDEAVGARATYGFSPGDADHPEPYAYVAPWATQPAGETWNATGFGGAELGYAELLAAPDPGAAVNEFFETRRAALAAGGEAT
jgi:hypothetical protein